MRLADHINTQECKGYTTVVRRAAASVEAHGTQWLVRLDRAVVRGATAKGRSSSRRLNRVLRSVVCDQLAANVVVGSLPVPTRFNPSDALTRDKRVRKHAARPYPQSLAGVDVGDYAAWDRRYGASQREVPAGVFQLGTRVPVARVAPQRGARDSALGVRSRANSEGDGPPLRERSEVVESRHGEHIRGPRASRPPSHL